MKRKILLISLIAVLLIGGIAIAQLTIPKPSELQENLTHEIITPDIPIEYLTLLVFFENESNNKIIGATDYIRYEDMQEQKIEMLRMLKIMKDEYGSYLEGKGKFGLMLLNISDSRLYNRIGYCYDFVNQNLVPCE